MKVVRSRKRAPIRPKPEPPKQRQPAQAPFVPTIFDQDTARARRRDHLPVQYTADFSLSDEIRSLCRPLAAEMTALFLGPMAGRSVSVWVREVGPVREVPFAAEVTEVSAAVHKLLLDVVRILAARELGASTAGRAAAAAMVSDPAFGPPKISGEDLQSGAWVDVLSGYAAPLEGELAAQLGRVARPDGRVSDASWELCEALGSGGTLQMKLASLERKIRESKLALEFTWKAEALAAEEQARRRRDRLQSLGLLT